MTEDEYQLQIYTQLYTLETNSERKDIWDTKIEFYKNKIKQRKKHETLSRTRKSTSTSS